MLQFPLYMDVLDLISAEYHDAILLALTLLGACVGSFLNVVVYRVPRGMSVHRPSRSFCPHCKTPIPWYLNIPLVSWLLLRGRSACCHRPISFRYWLVEAACAGLFFAIAYHYDYDGLPVQVMLCFWGACMLALLVMDWELMVVNVPLVLLAVALGLGAATLDPQLADASAIRGILGGDVLLAAPAYLNSGHPLVGLAWGGIGALGGYFLFRCVAVGGRLLFGRRTHRFSEPTAWQLRQVGEDIVLSSAGREYLWTEIFPEATARIVLDDATVAAVPGAAGRLVLEESSLVLPDGTRKSLEDYESLSGTCRAIRVRREAMGSGDPWLAMAIGAVCGWQGVIFALVAGSVIGLVYALLMRVRRGVPMPFGPSLVLAAFIWLLWGPYLLGAYLSLL